MGRRRLLRAIEAAIRATRLHQGASAASHDVADAKLDELDERLTRTVRDMADTLEQRAALMRRQRARQERRDNGGPAEATGR